MDKRYKIAGLILVGLMILTVFDNIILFPSYDNINNKDEDKSQIESQRTSYSPTLMNYTWEDMYDNNNLIQNPTFQTNYNAWTTYGTYIYGGWTISSSGYYGNGAKNDVDSGGNGYAYQLIYGNPSLNSSVILYGALWSNVLTDSTNYAQIELAMSISATTYTLIYQIKPTVFTDTSTVKYFLIGSSLSTWYYITRNVTADLLYKGLGISGTITSIYLRTKMSSSWIMYFDSLFLGYDKQMYVGDSQINNGEFERPQMSGTYPNDYPYGWSGAFGNNPSLSNSIDWTSKYLHYYSFAIYMTASATTQKYIYYIIGANPLKYLAYAINWYGTSDNSLINIRIQNSTHALCYEYSQAVGMQQTESSTFKIYHGKVSAYYWYYLIKDWKTDWQTKFGTAPNMANTWWLMIQQYEMTTSAVMSCRYDSIGMSDTIPIKYNRFMFSDSFNGYLNDYSSNIAGTSNKWGFDNDGLFIYGYDTGAGQTTETASLFTTINFQGYNYRKLTWIVNIQVLSYTSSSVIYFQYGNQTRTTMYWDSWWTNVWQNGITYCSGKQTTDITLNGLQTLEIIALDVISETCSIWLKIPYLCFEEKDTQIPNAPILLTPSNTESIANTTQKMSWQNVSWVGISATFIGFQLQIAQDVQFTNNVYLYNYSKSILTINFNLGIGLYYWRVRANSSSSIGIWSNTFTFQIVKMMVNSFNTWKDDTYFYISYTANVFNTQISVWDNGTLEVGGSYSTTISFVLSNNIGWHNVTSYINVTGYGYNYYSGYTVSLDAFKVDSFSMWEDGNYIYISYTANRIASGWVTDNGTQMVGGSTSTTMSFLKSNVIGQHNIIVYIRDYTIDWDTYYTFYGGYTITARTVYIYYHSTADNLGFDFDLVQTYLNGTRMLYNGYVISGNHVNISVKDFAGYTIMSSVNQMNGTLNIFDIGLNYQLVTFINNDNLHSILLNITHTTLYTDYNVTLKINPLGQQTTRMIFGINYTIDAFVQNNNVWNIYNSSTLIIDKDTYYYRSYTQPEGGTITNIYGGTSILEIGTNLLVGFAGVYLLASALASIYNTISIHTISSRLKNEEKPKVYKERKYDDKENKDRKYDKEREYS